jgi:hypothetical protein
MAAKYQQLTIIALPRREIRKLHSCGFPANLSYQQYLFETIHMHDHLVSTKLEVVLKRWLL